MYDAIKSYFKEGGHGYDGQSTLTTKLFTKYNFLSYPFPIIHDLYFTISKAFHLIVKDHYGYDPEEKYFIQCWLNYYLKGDFIDWHRHHPPEYSSWHGFLCVDTEPNSYTSYIWPYELDKRVFPMGPSKNPNILDIPSKDGDIIIGLSNGDEHRSSEWEHDRPRITIAFDILPAKSVSEIAIEKLPEPKYLNAMRDSQYFVNHWLPI